jgi:hypothetical protein
VSYSQLFSYYHLFSFRVLIVMERSDSHIFHISGFRPTALSSIGGGNRTPGNHKFACRSFFGYTQLLGSGCPPTAIMLRYFFTRRLFRKNSISRHILYRKLIIRSSLFSCKSQNGFTISLSRSARVSIFVQRPGLFRSTATNIDQERQV